MIAGFIARAQHITVPEELFLRPPFRDGWDPCTSPPSDHSTRATEHTVLLVSAMHDQDAMWNTFTARFFGLIGLGGYGGHAKYAKVRGAHRGAVILRWLNHVILLIGRYSPYLKLLPTEMPKIPRFNVAQLKPYALVSSKSSLHSHGCYKDEWQRDLPHLIDWYCVLR